MLLGDQIMTDPLLGVLGFNGGPTKTHTLLAGSPAIDAGSATGAPVVDQRGISRDATPDIGSFEYLNNILIVDTTSDTVDGNTSSIAALLGNKGTDGRISLREAILATNNTANLGIPDIIIFNIAGTGTHTIAPTSALPAITDAVTIDATSDDSFAANGNKPAIVLEGSDFGFGWNGLVLTSTADGSTIRGLVIRNWEANGILIMAGSDNNVIVGNYIGRLNPNGTASGAGTANNGDGVHVEGANNIIGGTVPGDGNVISGNSDTGIEIQGSNSTGNRIEGNIIGLNAAGTAAIGNLDGVIIEDAHHNTIGGATSAQRNVISGNTGGLQGNGVVIFGTNAIGNLVQNNYIGTDISGSLDLGNAGSGVLISDNGDGGVFKGGASGNTIRDNVLSGNNYSGVSIANSGANNNSIFGNLIGVDASGFGALGNSVFGVVIWNGASGNRIGGTAAGEGNVIAFNNRGVLVDDNFTASMNNAIRGNSIHSNALLGIDLKNDGVTVNDLGDGDLGPNGLRNYPVITSAVVSGTDLTITGTLNTLPFLTNQIDFYWSPTGDPSGHGEGQTFIGTKTVTSDFFGNASFNVTFFGVSVPVGAVITATATDLSGNTSEFAQNVTAIKGNEAPVIDDQSFSVDENAANGMMVGTVLATDPDAGDILTYAITAGNTGSAFAIDASTGQITVNNSSALDYETIPSFSLTVEVADSGTPGLADTATITINLNNINDAPVGVPVITGTVAEDQTLTADTSGISDADGLGAFSYRWLRNGAAITGATGTTYTLTDADVGQQISVEVSYTDTQGTPETVTSVQVGPVANVNDLPVGVPVITGTVAEDQTLTADTSGISDADGLGAFSYRWLRNGAAITGATGTTYTLTDADVGQQISVEVSYTDAQGTPETVTSAQVGPVANVNDLPVGVPVITGTVAEDQTLTADTSGISDADGLGAFSYRWLRNGAAITGATGSSYTLGDADVGQQISVQVSYTDGHGISEGPLTSAQVGPVANVNDLPAGVPVITGTVTEDQTLTADTSGISDADGLGAFSYRWLRNGAAITGATGTTYTLTDADVGQQISVEVSYTDAQGTPETLTSAQVGPVANVNDPGTVTIDNLAPAQGDTLTANVTDADGAAGAITYQWFRDGVAIGGASGKTYTIAQTDVGAVITVTADYTDDLSSVESLTSGPTAPVTNVNDPGMVSIDNLTPMEGDTLTANVSDTDGAGGTISYQWYRDGAAITGATGVSYLTVSADEGAVITVTADYTDDQGSVESLTSAGTAAVAHLNIAPTASNLNAAETYTEDIPLNLADIVIADVDSAAVTVSLTLSDPAAGSLSTGTSGVVTATYSGGVWSASGPIADVNALLAGVVFTPSANYDGSFAIGVSVNDGVAAPVTGIKIVTGTPVGDTPQVGSITTPVSVQSDLIVIDRNAADGAEVTHFRIANITNGTLYLADGITPIHDGDFITVAQGLAGVRFTPVADTLDNGSFTVESSEDGVSVAQQSGAAISVITVIPPPTSPTVNNPSASGDTAGPGPDTAPEAAEPAAEPEAAPEEDVPEAVAPPANRGPAEELVPQSRGLTHAPMPVIAQAVRYVIQMRAAGVDVRDIAERLSDNVGSSQKDAAADPGPQRADLQAGVHNLISARAYLNMVNSLDAVKKEMAGDNQLNRVYLGSAIVSSIGLSVGYVVWLIRGGLLLSSLLSSLPAWQILDPLPILARKKDDDLSEDEESLESILDRKPPEPKPKKEPADASWDAEEKKR